MFQFKFHRTEWWVGGQCDFSVSPEPFGLEFGTLDFGLTTKEILQKKTGVMKGYNIEVFICA